MFDKQLIIKVAIISCVWCWVLILGGRARPQPKASVFNDLGTILHFTPLTDELFQHYVRFYLHLTKKVKVDVKHQHKWPHWSQMAAWFDTHLVLSDSILCLYFMVQHYTMVCYRLTSFLRSVVSAVTKLLYVLIYLLLWLHQGSSFSRLTVCLNASICVSVWWSQQWSQKIVMWRFLFLISMVPMLILVLIQVIPSQM